MSGGEQLKSLLPVILRQVEGTLRSRCAQIVRQAEVPHAFNMPLQHLLPNIFVHANVEDGGGSVGMWRLVQTDMEEHVHGLL